MATKKPSVATQLKAAKNEIAFLANELAAVKKAKESAESNKDYYYKEKTSLQKELSDIHDLIDVLEGAIPKRKDGEYTDTPVMLRLASWLANRK